MILHHKNISQLTLSFQTTLKYSDKCSFIPIQMKDYHVIQTPTMFIPYGIFTNDNQKSFIDITFYNSVNDKELNDFYKSLKKISSIVKNKYPSIKVNSFLKQTPFNHSMRLRIDTNALFFNEAKQKIETIKSNSYGQFLISLYGLWLIDNELWFQWILIQGKIKAPIQFNNLLIDEINTKKNTKKTTKKNIPPPPPLPIFKKTNHKIIISKTKKNNKKEEKNFKAPSIEELQTILSNLKNVNLSENKI